MHKTVYVCFFNMLIMRHWREERKNPNQSFCKCASLHSPWNSGCGVSQPVDVSWYMLYLPCWHGDHMFVSKIYQLMAAECHSNKPETGADSYGIISISAFDSCPSPILVVCATNCLVAVFGIGQKLSSFSPHAYCDLQKNFIYLCKYFLKQLPRVSYINQFVCWHNLSARVDAIVISILCGANLHFALWFIIGYNHSANMQILF